MSLSRKGLGDLCDIRIGKTPSRDQPKYWHGGRHHWVSIADMGGRFIRQTKERITDLAIEESGCHLVQTGTHLLSFKLSLGKVAFAGMPLFTNEAIAALPFRKPDILNPLWFYYRLLSLDWAKFGRRAVKGNCLNKEILEEVEIEFPDLSEQKRIAGMLAEADRLRRTRRYVLELSNTFLPAIFTQLFGDPRTNPMKWKVVPIEEVLEFSQYGTSQKSNNTKRGYPILGMGNLTYSGEIDLSNLSYVAIQETGFREVQLQRGDIIFNRTNSSDLVGKTAHWNNDLEATFASYLVRLRLKPEVLPEFFTSLLNTSYFKRIFQERCKKAVGQSNISPTLLKEFPIYIPPRSQQNHFANLVAKHNCLRANQREALRQADHLFSSLLNKTFT